MTSIKVMLSMKTKNEECIAPKPSGAETAPTTNTGGLSPEPFRDDKSWDEILKKHYLAFDDDDLTQ